MNRLTAYSTESITNPQAGMAPIKNAAIDNVNRNYMNVAPRLASQFASRGYGSSGSFGNTLFQTELARGGDLSNIEAQFAKSALDQKNYGASLGESLLNFGRGSSTSATATGTTPSTALSNGLLSGGNALENLSKLLMFSKVLKGSGSASNTDYGG